MYYMMPRDNDSDIEAIDDDDMPPLVEAPPSMAYQYTFCTGMTPLSFEFASSEPNANAIVPYTPEQPTASIEELESFVPGPTRTSHAKRRDASYIPRPPNAFILFRSSFIREQKVTGRVEGNHSNLSKIVGMYWKSLPKAERKTWEDKAKQAQHEHRRRYPDWRFSPGANAAANARVRHQILDTGGGEGGRKRRGSTSIRGAKDPPDRDGSWNDNDNENKDEMEVVDDDDDSDYEDTPSRRGKARRRAKGKGKGRAKARSARGRLTRARASTSEKASVDARKVGRAALALDTDKEKDKQWENERIVKIVDFLMQGKKGNELERAVEEWDRGEASFSTDETLQPKDESSPAPSLIITINPAPPSLEPSRTSTPTPTPTLTHSSVLSPCSPPQPLSPEVGTTMNVHGVKRSLSAPAQEQRFVQVDEGRKRHRSSVSVEFEVDGGNKEVQPQRRETVSLPFLHPRKLEGGGYGYAGEYAYGGVQRSQTFPPMDIVHHTGFGTQRSIFVGSEGYASVAFGPNTNTVNASARYYHPTATTPVSTSMWHNQPPHVPTYAPNWWPSHAPITATTQPRVYNYEPTREGSFDCVEGGYEDVRGPVYAEMHSRYIEVSPSSASASEEWTTSVVPVPTTESESRPVPAYNTYPPQTQTQTPTQEMPNAGGFFCPPAPSPLPASTFSSLTGWDGRSGSGHQVVQGQQWQGQGPWFGWGSVQRLGLGGGSGRGETT